MKLFVFILTYPLIWVLSRLPMRLLYIFSDFFFFLIYHVFGYRKKVVFSNIRMAFPEKSEKEVQQIGEKFFTHLTDLIFESIKSFSISEKSLKKRYRYKNTEVINKLFESGKSIALMGCHHNNWEWSYSIPFFTDISCYGAYTKINNPYFEKVIKTSRTRFGFDGVPTTIFSKTIKKRVQNQLQSLYILLSDQSPQFHKTRYWGNFLNQFVPVHTGAELLSKKHNFAVVNMLVTKIKRGYYEANFELITDDATKFDNFEITDTFLKMTEKHIKTQPEYYLWSHKRFKHVGKYDEWVAKQEER